MLLCHGVPAIESQYSGRPVGRFRRRAGGVAWSAAPVVLVVVETQRLFAGVLCDLVEHGIVARKDIGEHGERFEYRLTPKGDALLPVLSTLREWGDEWIFRAGNEPLIMNDRAEGEPLALTQVRDVPGNAMSRRDIRARPGPGADEQTKTLFGRGESEST